MIALTEAEVDEARAGGEAAAARRDGSAEDVPYRLLGAPDREKALALSRLWFMAFSQARAWQREQQAGSVTAALAFAFDPTQKRGRDGRWVKYIFGANALLGLFRPSARESQRQLLASWRGKEFRDFKRGQIPSNKALKQSLEWTDVDLQSALDDAPATPDNALVWYRPNIWYKDADFPTDPAVGDVISDSAPITTEYEKPPAAAPFKYAIRVPEGTERTLAIPPLGQYKADKGGMLIGDGAQFKVADVEVDGRGRKTILLDVLEPEEQIATPGGVEDGVTVKTPAPSAEEAIAELRRLLGEPVGTPDEIPDWERELLDPTRPQPVPVAEDPNAPKPADAPIPDGLRRTVPTPEDLAAWKKKPPPTPAEVEEARKVIRDKHGMGSRYGRHPRGTVETAALLDAAGYNAKPTVLSPEDFDKFKGKKIPYFKDTKPRETFIRAGYSNQMYDNITGDPEYFIGRGIFGNGTFMGDENTAKAFGGWDRGSVKRTTSRGGREAIRLKIHPDAKIVDWPDVPPEVQRHARMGSTGENENSLEAWSVRNGVDIVNTSLGHGDYMAGVNVMNRAVLIVEELV